MEFIEEQIRKNIANRVAIEKAMGKEFTESDCLDLLEKAGKAAQMGEVRTWSGKEYIKTPKGWRPKPKGYKEGGEKEGEKNGVTKIPDLCDISTDKIKQAQENIQGEINSLSEKFWNTPNARYREEISEQIDIARKLADTYQKELDKRKQKQEITEAGNPVGKPLTATPKKVTDQLKVGDRVMYHGKEMILTRISKDGRFQNGIEMKFVNEGDSTPTGGKTLQGNMMYAKPVKEKRPTTAANKLEGSEKEQELFDKDGDQLNVRVYKDGGVKVEGLNVRKDFDNITEAWNFLVRNGYTRSEEE